MAEVKETCNMVLERDLVWCMYAPPGLVSGLVVGLVVGFVVGLVLGLVLGFFVGLVLGFVVGLVLGLVVGLVLGLVLRRDRSGALSLMSTCTTPPLVNVFA